jgi:hypothetical protein
MTQFQALAILTPVVVLVVMIAVARWARLQDQAVLAPQATTRAKTEKPAQPLRKQSDD